jgi:hypothetical protein
MRQEREEEKTQCDTGVHIGDKPKEGIGERCCKTL